MPKRQAPGAPKKKPYPGIKPSSPEYTENNENNIKLQNVEDIKEVNISAVLQEVKEKGQGNQLPPSTNLPLKKGGKRTRKHHKKTRKHKRKHTRRH